MRLTLMKSPFDSNSTLEATTEGNVLAAKQHEFLL